MATRKCVMFDVGISCTSVRDLRIFLSLLQHLQNNGKNLKNYLKYRVIVCKYSLHLIDIDSTIFLADELIMMPVCAV